MESFIARTHLQVPARRVWEVLADYPRDVEWRRGVLEMRVAPDGPLAVGSVTHEVLRLGGRTYRNDGVVVAVEAGRRFDWRTTSGAAAHGSRLVEPTDDGCEVTLELHVEPTGVDRLLAPFLRPMLAKNLRADLDRLADLLVAGVAATPV